jgi:hypothetical protein
MPTDFTDAEAWQLAKMLYEHRGKSRTELPAKEQERLKLLLFQLDQFLWEACRIHAQNFHHAYHAAGEARKAWLTRLGWSRLLAVFSDGVKSLVFPRHTPRSWLVQKAREVVTESKSDAKDGWLRGNPEISQEVWAKIEENYLRAHQNGCELFTSRRSSKFNENPYCQKVCELRFYEDILRLTYRDVACLTGVRKTTVGTRLKECKRREEGPGKSAN